MKQKILPLIGLSLLAFTGCGGDGGPMAASGNVSAAQITGGVGANLATFANGITADQSGQQTPLGNGTIPVTAGASLSIKAADYDDCGSYVIKNQTDADGDSIPVQVKIKYDCAGIVDGTNKKDLQGTTEIRDLDDSKAGYDNGYLIAYDLKEVEISEGHAEPATYSFNGMYSLKNTGTKMVYDYAFTWTSVMPWHKPPVDAEYRQEYTVVRTPTDMAHPFDEGVTTIKGHFKLKDYARINGKDVKVEVVFEISGVDMQYSSDGGTCGGRYYRGGTLTYKDGGGNMVKTVFSCDSDPVYYYNGKVITW